MLVRATGGVALFGFCICLPSFLSLWAIHGVLVEARVLAAEIQEFYGVVS